MFPFFLVVVSAASLFAQPPSPVSPAPQPARPTRVTRTPPAPQGPPGSVRGQIVSAGGEPIRKAEISLSGPNSYSTSSDSNGNFAFAQVAPGSYSIAGRRVGYARSSDRNRIASVTVASGQESTGIVLKLNPQATISGKVTDEDGDVVMDANVQILRESWQKGRKTILPVQAAPLNDLGEFRVAGLNAGRYYMVVASGRRGRGESSMGYASMYYPGVFDPVQAQATELLPGQEMRLDMRLRKVATFKIRGRVIDGEAAGQSRGVAVSAVQDSPAGVFLHGNQYARVQNDGWFELAGLTPGTYKLQAARMDRDGTRGGTSIQIGNRDVDNVVLQLQRPVKAPYAIRVEGDGAVDTSMVRVQVETEPGLEMGGTGRPEPGAVMLPGYGRVRLSAQGLPEGTYVESIRLGALDVSNGYFEAGASAGSIDVLLSRGAGQASGTVATPGAFVVLAPETSQRAEYWKFRTVTADSTGNFVFKNLPPGEYVAFALKDSHDGAYQDPEFLKTIEGKGVRVKLGEGGSETVSLKLAE